MGIKNTARKYLKHGLNVIPTTANKLPAIGNWTKYQKRCMTSDEFENTFNDDHNIGVLTGGPSRVVCLDADMKYDLSGDLWDRFFEKVPEELKEKMLHQSTKNKGYHLAFKAPANKLVGNEKLAARPTTADERHHTYMEAYTNPETKEKATKIAINDNSRILFETRSGSAEACGGYFLMYPSRGYVKISGKIGELTEEEYDFLMDLARSFNEVSALDTPITKHEYIKDWELDPFSHYNRDGDIISVMEDNGWKIVLPQQGRNIRLLRPGHTHSQHSAIYDVNTGVLNVFSTSTVFDVQRGYSKASVFIILACQGDPSVAYRSLVDMGYGVAL